MLLMHTRSFTFMSCICNENVEICVRYVTKVFLKQKYYFRELYHKNKTRICQEWRITKYLWKASKILNEGFKSLTERGWISEILIYFYRIKKVMISHISNMEPLFCYLKHVSLLCHMLLALKWTCVVLETTQTIMFIFTVSLYLGCRCSL